MNKDIIKTNYLWIRRIAKGSYYYKCYLCGCKTNLIYSLETDDIDSSSLFLVCQECMDKRNQLLRDISNERD